MGKRNSRYRLKKRPADIQAASSSEEAATQKPIMKRQLDNDTFDAASLKKRKGEAPSDDREVDALNRDDTRSKNQIHKKIRRQNKYELHSSRPKTVGQRRSILEEIKMCTSVEERAKLQLKLVKMLDCRPENKDVRKITRAFRRKRAARKARAAMVAESMHAQRLHELIHESVAGASDSSRRSAVVLVDANWKKMAKKTWLCRSNPCYCGVCMKKRPAEIETASSSEPEAATQKPIMNKQLDNDNFDAVNPKKREREAPSNDRKVDALDRDDTQSKNEIHKKIKQRNKYELHSSRPKTVGCRRSILEEIKMCTSVEERAKLQLKLVKMLDCIPESKDVLKIARTFRSKRAARRARAAMRAEAMHTQRLPESIHESAAGVIRFK